MVAACIRFSFTFRFTFGITAGTRAQHPKRFWGCPFTQRVTVETDKLLCLFHELRPCMRVVSTVVPTTYDIRINTANTSAASADQLRCRRWCCCPSSESRARLLLLWQRLPAARVYTALCLGFSLAAIACVHLLKLILQALLLPRQFTHL